MVWFYSRTMVSASIFNSVTCLCTYYILSRENRGIRLGIKSTDITEGVFMFWNDMIIYFRI